MIQEKMFLVCRVCLESKVYSFRESSIHFADFYQELGWRVAVPVQARTMIHVGDKAIQDLDLFLREHTHGECAKFELMRESEMQPVAKANPRKEWQQP